jgi:hypothetical protein
MLKIEKTVLPSPEQWEIIIEGLRNPMNSWDKMDSHLCEYSGHTACGHMGRCEEGLCYDIGEKDHNLMAKLAKGGAVHAKYRRMIPVYVTINAPLYWWKEFDTYKVGTVANSCSTMHKIHSKEFTLDDFSHEHLITGWEECLINTIHMLNYARDRYLETKAKQGWWQMIQMLPTSYNQKRTVMLNYEVLVGIYRDRRNHKLDCWHTFCDWIETLPYAKGLIYDVGNDI